MQWLSLLSTNILTASCGIDDDCYRGVSEEEMQERIRRLQELAWELRAKREVNRNGKENV